LIKEFANHLPGDPRKVAEAVLMLTGLDDPPLRLLLSRDVLKAVRDARSEKTPADARSEKTEGWLVPATRS
jgi:hypothetical protein